MAWRTVLLEYPVYKSLAEVPRDVFKNPALVVERFLPEKEGDRYFMRLCFFLGDRELNARVAGPEPVIKRRNAVLVEEGIQVPEPVRRLRRELGLDYGKIDYAIHDGEVVIFDVNRTPLGAGTDTSGWRITAALADGIWSLLPDPLSAG